MNHGIWATWYDVDPANQERWLAWAHETYLPYLQSACGYAWAAHYRLRGGGPQMDKIHEGLVRQEQVQDGAGREFLILVGAPSVHAFFKPALDEIQFPQGFDEMLALRRSVAVGLFTEEAGVKGPSFERFGQAVPAPGIQMGSFCLRSPEDEFEIGRWYAQYRLPSMAAMPGAVRTRKLSGVAGWAKHAILYEFESLDMRLKHFEQTHESLALDPSHWTGRIVKTTVHAPGSPFIGERLWPAVASQ
jgi:hypothetical protein